VQLDERQESASVATREGQSRARALLACWLCSIWLLTACSGQYAPLPLHDVHLPGVVRITAFDALTAPRSYLPQLEHIAVYQRGASVGEIHLLANTTSQLYEAGITDQAAHSIALTHGTCSGEIATSWDSRWAACDANEGAVAFPVPLERTASEQPIMPGGTPAQYFYAPSWGPDTHSLAAGKVQTTGQGWVGFYRFSDSHDAVHLEASLTIEGDAPISRLEPLLWSPDGQWLAVPGALLPIRSLLTAPNGRTLTHATVLPGALAGLSVPTDGTIAWRSTGVHGASLTLVRGPDIIQHDAATGRETTLLSVPDGNMCALAWTQDGQHLIFQVCGIGSGEVAPLPAKLYMYTPEAT
jgi:hypothetical protein